MAKGDPPENVPGEPHPGFDNGEVADLSPGYIPGEPDEGFPNGSILDTHATNSAVVGSSNADPVEVEAESGDSAPSPGSAAWLDASTVEQVNDWLDENPDERDAVVKLERKREHPRKGITGD